MTSYFPDLNVWLALSVQQHSHRQQAWDWRDSLSVGRILLCRYTHLGQLRLLTNRAVMGEQTLTLGEAWAVVDAWQADPMVEFAPEPRGIDGAFREVTASFATQQASKVVGDCYLLAYARACGATLVTFDRALAALARKHGCDATIPR